MKYVYMIYWQGRDCDSGVWSNDYPVDSYGAFSNKADAEIIAKHCNRLDPPSYDVDAGRKTGFYAKSIELDNPKSLELIKKKKHITQ